MTKGSQIYKSIFLIIVFLFGVVTLYAIKTEEAPRFILFFGRFHPLLLHLPIGALVVTFFIDVLGRFQKDYAARTVRNLLGFTATFAIITCFLGYFLSLEGGYNQDTLDLHFYTGIATAVLTCVLFLLSLKPSFNANRLFLFVFLVTLVCISVAGHYGSVLTHGDKFITEYIAAPEKEKTIEVVDSLKLYQDVVKKILDKKCVQCHNTAKQKGALSLLSEASILKGGESGASIITGNANESLLYSRLTLPISDEKHMPPEGKEQVTKDEKWLLKYWINEGADFKNYVPNVASNVAIRKKLEKYLVFNKVEIAKAPKSAILEVKEAGFRVFELVPDEGGLHVKCIDKTPTEESIESLNELKEQIVELDFRDSPITDEMTSILTKLNKITKLSINSPKITDATISNLKSLVQLEVLNLYNTSISNEGLRDLLKSIKPKQIYVWQTNIDRETAALLSLEYDVSIHQSILEGFVTKNQLEPPTISPIKTLFKDTIHVNSNSRIKGAAIHYTLDGSVPDSTSLRLTDKLIFNSSTMFKASAFKEGWLPSVVSAKHFSKVRHEVTTFNLKQQPDKRYPGAHKLFDLNEGSLDFKDGNWIGYFGNDLFVTIDLEVSKKINNISFNTIEDVNNWILFPTEMVVTASNDQFENFKKIGAVSISRKGEKGDAESKTVTLTVPETSVRYIKIHIKNFKNLPSWHPNTGNPSWLFVDEIYLW